MKVTGYQLREAVKRATQRAEMAKLMFKDSQVGFADEQKDPLITGATFNDAGIAVAALQAAQQHYNHIVELTGISMTLPASQGKVYNRTMTLAEGVKLVGHAGAVEKEWRLVAGVKKERHYGLPDGTTERDVNKTYAKKLITPAVAMAKAEEAGKFAARLRAAIAVANNTEIEVDLPADLF